MRFGAHHSSKVWRVRTKRFNKRKCLCSAPLAETVCTVIYFLFWFDYRVVHFYAQTKVKFMKKSMLLTTLLLSFAASSQAN